MSVPASEPILGIDDVHYTQDMNAASCGCGECDGYSYDPPCHPGAGLAVQYRKSKGVMLIACARCKRHYETVAVAKRIMH